MAEEPNMNEGERIERKKESRTDDQRPSFSVGRKWSIGLNVAVILVLLLAVVTMVNYISRAYSVRLHLSTRGNLELAPRTVQLLKSLTNQVKVTLYYDKDDPFYDTVADQLKEYHLRNSRIAIQRVDYLRDPATAQEAKRTYKLNSVTDTNLIIFDSGGRTHIVRGSVLVGYTEEQIKGNEGLEFRRKPIEFRGEMAFTSALIEVTNPKKFVVYFLQGGNFAHSIESADPVAGYVKLAELAIQSGAEVRALSLPGTNSVPPDCSLLVVPGPRGPLSTNELAQIEQYLEQGGRLLALLNADTSGRATGLERILGNWGVAIGQGTVGDPRLSPSSSTNDLQIQSLGTHPLVSCVVGHGLYLLRPRPVGRIRTSAPSADAPQVDEIAFMRLLDRPGEAYVPLMAIIEKGTVPGGVSERGTARILVSGDSYFLANEEIEQLGNRDFAWSALAWLLGRGQLVGTIGPRPVSYYPVLVTQAQLQGAGMLLLVYLPGGVLVLGGLVWLRRRR